MRHSRTDNSKIDRLQQKYLSIIYNDEQSSFKELIEKDSSVFVEFMKKNVQALATEMYNVSSNFSLLHLNKIFEVRN